MIALLLAAAAASAPVLTLEEAEAKAHDNLPSVHLAVAQTRAQHALRDEAFSAYMPQVAGTAALNLLSLTTVGPAESQGAKFSAGTNPGNVVAGQTLTAGVSATQLIYDFNQTLDKIHSADASEKAQKDNEDLVWNNSLQTVRNAYFVCQEDLALIGVAQKTLDDDQQHVDEMNSFVQAGTHTVVDLVQAQQVAAAAKLTLVQAKGNYRGALANLMQAMGVDTAPDHDVTTDDFPAVAGEEKLTDDVLADAIKERWEIRQLMDEISAQRLTVSANREGWLPQFFGNASAGLTLNEYLGAVPPPTPAAKLGVSMNWPFYSGGITAAATAQAEAVLDELQAQLDASKQQVRNDIEVARVAIISGKEQIESARESEKFAKEQLRLADGQYKAGVGIALAVFDAEVAVTTAGGQIAQSVAVLAIARAQFARALGHEKY